MDNTLSGVPRFNVHAMLVNRCRLVIMMLNDDTLLDHTWWSGSFDHNVALSIGGSIEIRSNCWHRQSGERDRQKEQLSHPFLPGGWRAHRGLRTTASFPSPWSSQQACRHKNNAALAIMSVTAWRV
jgi:hypothetical protein